MSAVLIVLTRLPGFRQPDFAETVLKLVVFGCHF